MASDFWDEQAKIMSKPSRPARPVAKQQLETAGPAALSPVETAGPGPNILRLEPDASLLQALEDKRLQLAKIEQWLRVTEATHPRWEEGVRRYAAMNEEIKALQAELDGPLAYLRRPGGDGYEGVVIFPAETAVPQIAGHWQPLPDGRIEARVTLFELRIMAEMAKLIRVD